MKRLALLVALLAAALPAPAAAQTPAPTKTPGELVVALSMPTAGFQVGAVRGREVLLARGYEVDLARELAARLGVPAVRFVNDDRFTAWFQPGVKDWDLALAQVTVTDAREAVIDFSTPYFTADQAVLLRRGLTLKRRTLAQLRGLRLCAIRATTSATAARRVRPQRPVRLFRDASRLELSLYHRQCDAIVGDAPGLGALRAQAPERFGELAGRLGEGDRYGIVLEPGSGLRAPVDAALAALEADGTLGRLAARWLTTDVSRLPRFR